MITARPLYPAARSAGQFLFVCYAGFMVFLTWILTSLSAISPYSTSNPELAVAIVVGFIVAGLGICTRLQTEGAKYGLMICSISLGFFISLYTCTAPMPTKFEPDNSKLDREVIEDLRF